MRVPTMGAKNFQYSSPPPPPHPEYDDMQMQNTNNNNHHLHDSGSSSSGYASPYNVASSPWNQPISPYARSPWSFNAPASYLSHESSHHGASGVGPPTGLIGSLVREDGHVCSLAAAGELLYTGSDSKNVRVWRNQKEYSGFKSSSGLVKAIALSADRVFTGHQDGKIRVWRTSGKDPAVHRRAGSLPKLKDCIKSSFNPGNYVEVRRHRSALWIRHFDAVSCLSLSPDDDLLYSGSWDKTFKVWRISDSKCLESVAAHDDAVNSVVAGPNGLVFTGSADGSVKAWRREAISDKTTSHAFVQTLLKLDGAVTALAMDATRTVLYSGSSDGLVNFWEIEKRSVAHGGVLRGHKLAVLCLAAAGESVVLSGSADRTICVWRREVGGRGGEHSCLAVLSGHLAPVKCLAVEEEVGETRGGAERRWVVYSGSLDRSVKVWRVTESARGGRLAPNAVGRGGGKKRF